MTDNRFKLSKPPEQVGSRRSIKSDARIVGKCTICRFRKRLEKHHTKPAVGELKKEGPTIMVFPDCHERMHREIGNSRLREMTIADIQTELGPFVQPEDQIWCAFCGIMTDHGSGSCPDLQARIQQQE